MIHSVMGLDGTVLEGEVMISEFVSFYEQFLGGEHEQPSMPSYDLFSTRLDSEIASGKLPVKYLGVPLISSRLTSQNCIELLDRMDGRISSWNNKFLSYAGRLQLVRSVLSSMHIFWAAAFILPTYIAKEIESKLKNFLWGGKEDKKVIAKVAWKKVCLPKKEGGLGVRRVLDMNMALMVQWREGDNITDFTTSIAWDAIRVKEDHVDWAELVWPSPHYLCLLFKFIESPG
ncbi:hypothetical protein QVD17_06846 [Tagetes erecta]|uniref:Reverse transcriptase n=1 Tax=Tagetes erecta TaxID=13708 RepID=A0AAD8LP84_TARER|nr:hypothetical protein QVD17_06846 [Tagetes erecta]